ncbi:hypothetical protein GCM10011348_38210 [Marinobacterium nitratireducens]|uniref:DUF2889 domain-containing protein n=1 Tax=Marinobacterium nitratireducens TaxID=518897 RepID=A0A917ZNA8_9GAMM|nr:DUF2889 domain-containing protein [Marinobacterium nitratireducens]GGO86719.1 hypothetical protein GCM10011348_38210 [Marinobacterium nitratireducens]
MPLPKPARRQQYHQRNVRCTGYLRDDGLWDIEGRMTDIKSHDIDIDDRDHGYVAAGEPFHDISMRLTIDETMLIHEVQAAIDAAPFRTCPAIAAAFKRLEGTRIGSGWLRQTRELVGGVEGCTHLNEMLQPLATTAVQMLWPVRAARTGERAHPGVINTCHTYAQDSEVVRRVMPDHYKPAKSDS